MATTADRPRTGSRSGSGSARRRAASSAPGGRGPAGAEPTKAQTRPKDTPEKAHKPSSAAAAGRAGKARKPASARKVPAPRPSAGGDSGPRRSKKRSARGSGTGAALPAPKATKALAKAAAPGQSSLVGRAGWKLAKLIAGRALSSGAQTVSTVSRDGLGRAAAAAGSLRRTTMAATSTSVATGTARRPPIQAAVDAAVPGWVAWREWSRLQWLPEGVDSVIGVQRDDAGELTGRLAGRRGHKWAASILDEREQESFAWESNRGSDCAGLITFHELGERLTRIELSLDVRPLSLAQAAALATHRADRRAAQDLRRFKARLELINPDAYEVPDDPSG